MLKIFRRQNPSFLHPHPPGLLPDADRIVKERSGGRISRFSLSTSFHRGSPCSHITWAWTVGPFVAHFRDVVSPPSTWSVQYCPGVWRLVYFCLAPTQPISLANVFVTYSMYTSVQCNWTNLRLRCAKWEGWAGSWLWRHTYPGRINLPVTNWG
jgi:hypothetical protein